jgi:hypothetical protein
MKPKPGLREYTLVAAIVRLVTTYCGKAPDPVLIVNAFTKPGMALDRFKARDFGGAPDIATLIA